jgi:hypothetical protein
MACAWTKREHPKREHYHNCLLLDISSKSHFYQPKVRPQSKSNTILVGVSENSSLAQLCTQRPLFICGVRSSEELWPNRAPTQAENWPDTTTTLVTWF